MASSLFGHSPNLVESVQSYGVPMATAYIIPTGHERKHPWGGLHCPFSRTTEGRAFSGVCPGNPCRSPDALPGDLPGLSHAQPTLLLEGEL
jgi:hypothetical protein